MSPEAPSCQYAPTRREALDPVAAVAFMEHQGCALRAALARPGDRLGLAHVAVAQERAHESWLALVGAAHRGGHTVLADRLASLYALHGRISALLERGLDPALDDEVAARVRVQLVAELHERTADCVDRVLSLAPRPRQILDEA